MFSYQEVDDPDELGPSDKELLDMARKAAKNAYAPYSRFKVGAALRLESGKITIGTNVENAAFPSGICAERTAISNASSNYPGDKPVALAIAAITGEGYSDEIVSPCGNCRQVIAEEESRYGNNIRIILSSRKKIWIIEKGGDLLPLQFSKDHLRAALR
ncbi:MAG TPA: cytidine deaminase [Bacteroidales bacterium]|nr:cytidine deaminase [Bacteroidales bacterium]